MVHLTDITGLLGVASATAGLLPGPAAKLSKSRRTTLFVSTLLLMLIPFGDISLAGYVRGATGDLSITTLVLVWVALFRPPAFQAGHRFAPLLLIAAAALFLYPLALGIGMFDPYRLGYGELPLLATLLFVALYAWFWSHTLIALCIALAMLAWAVGWYESANLWDYLLDPFVSVYALAALAKHSVKSLRRQGKSRRPQTPG
ncbi:MAG: hypothetical protein HY016_03455 [Nitrosomonadales bacterium]|nr:hypothetical protein [Nitrosomonadales bacterium]